MLEQSIHDLLVKKVESISELKPFLPKEKLINFIVSQLVNYGGIDSCNIVSHFDETLEAEISKILDSKGNEQN